MSNRSHLKYVGEELGCYGIHRRQSLGKPTWEIECSRDPSHRYQVSYPGETPYQVILKKFGTKGWDLTRNRPPGCPYCKRMEKNMSKPQNIGPDPKIARRIYAKLDEFFDENARRYQTGWSDERIAKEIDTSADLVSRIRREAYGELAEDPQVAQLRDDIAYARIEFDDAINKIVQSFNAKLSELEIRLAKASGSHHKAAG